MNQIIVDFSIFSDSISFLEIDNILGVTHDDYCNKGGRINDMETGAINHQNIWIKSSGIKEDEFDLSIHLESLFKLLEPIKLKIMNLKLKGCNFQVSIFICNEEINPGGYIDTKYVSFFGDIGAAIDFDIYKL